MSPPLRTLGLPVSLLLAACATPPPAAGPGQGVALSECRERARKDRREWRQQYWSEIALWIGGGAAGGALAGVGTGYSLDAMGQGAAFGAAAGAGLGLLIGVATTQFEAHQRFRAQVDRCLAERGYAVRWK
jgi:hypothetical protein